MATSLQKIKNISRFGSFIVTLLLITIPIFYIAKWILIDQPMIKQLAALGICCAIKGPTAFIKPWMIAWTPGLKLLGLGADLIGHLPMWFSFFILKFILKNYSEGNVFTTINARYYQYLAGLFLLSALVCKPIFDAMMTLVATLNNPPGERILSLTFNITNIQEILWGGFVMIIAYVMSEASKLEEEQQLTI
ncbi:MAG: DUF2975 domain-containing protein [Chthoniobacterales bacterium]|nr:DUF2975 domain-containing protein [Chthoniobacterales bacterium]